MEQWFNKAFASGEELKSWNKDLADMRRGTFSPRIVEMISDAERENAEKQINEAVS